MTRAQRADALERALAADVAVVCGGVSVGAHDHVKAALAELGAEQAFWGVALRPGRPTWFGVRGGGPAAGGALAFGLPGNPVSAFVTFVLFVRPALRRCAGAPDDSQSATATLTADVPRLTEARPGRALLARARRRRLAGEPRPGRRARTCSTSMLGADALAVVAAGPEPARAGERVQVELLRA